MDIKGVINQLLKETKHWDSIIDFRYIEGQIEKFKDDQDFILLAQKDNWRLPTDFFNTIIFHKLAKDDKEAYEQIMNARNNGYFYSFSEELKSNVLDIANSSYPFYKWYKNKAVFSFDEGLRKTLANQTEDFAINKYIPTYALKNLPLQCFYVYLGYDFYIGRNMNKELEEILINWLPNEKRKNYRNDLSFLGFFVIDDRDPLMGEHFLSIKATFYSASANHFISTIVFLYLPDGDETTFSEANIRQLDGQSEGLNKKEVTILRREIYSIAIQFVLYLCSDNAEINQNEENAKYYRKPLLDNIKNRLREVAVFDVGVCIGNRIKETEGEKEREGAHYIDIPRRAHWHHYWVGRRNTSERRLVLRWLLPTFVRYENSDSLQDSTLNEDGAPPPRKNIVFDIPKEEVIDDELEDMKFIDQLEQAIDLEESTTALTYAETPQSLPDLVIEGERTRYKRDRSVAKNALKNADYRCEIDPSHYTFIRKKIDLPYTEPHHLIPMYYQSQYNVSLDVEQNIISLCSNCHKQLHYGRKNEELIERLYRERSSLLENAGITITVEELLEVYK